jgi:hypothetical protein
MTYHEREGEIAMRSGDFGGLAPVHGNDGSGDERSPVRRGRPRPQRPPRAFRHENSTKIDIQRSVEVLHGDVGDETSGADAGQVQDGVNTSELLHCFCDQRFDISLLRHFAVKRAAQRPPCSLVTVPPHSASRRARDVNRKLSARRPIVLATQASGGTYLTLRDLCHSGSNFQ